jgi:hypothetical protein
MRTRAVAGVIAGLLLPLPLVLLLAGGWREQQQQLPLTASRVSPSLEFEEKMRRQTYYRHCRDDSECEPPLGCLTDMRRRWTYCTDSQCMTDTQCPEGEVCRSIESVGGQRVVRMCIPLGVRKEGEQCWPTPTTRNTACGAGLLCAGEGWCGRPCGGQGPSGCPEGFFCADVGPEPVCLPSCQGRSCPEGQQCVRHEDGVSACARIFGANCQDDATCASCEVSSFPAYPGQAWMECVRRCGLEGSPPCPEGTGCGMLQCRPVCDPKVRDACGEGFYCARGGADRLPVCMPEWMRSKD